MQGKLPWKNFHAIQQASPLVCQIEDEDYQRSSKYKFTKDFSN